MKFFYYLVYAIRRFTHARSGERPPRDWRAWLVLLLVEVRLVFAIVYIFLPSLLKQQSSLFWGLAIGLPVFFATYAMLRDHGRYERLVSEFEGWSRKKRLIADVLTTGFVFFAIVSPLIARSMVTGKSWWD